MSIQRVGGLRHDRRGGVGFPDEPLPEAPVLGEVGGQQLQGNLPARELLLGQIDDAHPAPAEQRLDPVASDLRADA